MAKFPDGIILITRPTETKTENGNIVVNFETEERELVMCKNCRHWWAANGLCTHSKHVHGNVCCYECGAEDYCSCGEQKKTLRKHG